MLDPLLSVRAALTATANTVGGDSRTGIGGNEIQKMIDKVITDDVNRDVDLLPLIPRKPKNQLSFIWTIRTNLRSTSKAAFYSDGAGGTPYESTKVQYFAVALALRSDYAVTGLVQAAASGFYDALEDEARDALSRMIIVEENAIISGTDTSAYGLSGAYNGLLQLMGSNATFADTDTIFGTAREGA